MNSLCAVVTSWLNTFQRSQVGVGRYGSVSPDKTSRIVMILTMNCKQGCWTSFFLLSCWPLRAQDAGSAINV